MNFVERGKRLNGEAKKVSKVLTALTLAAIVLSIAVITPVFADIPPLVTVTFPVGSYVIPMDEKQVALTAADTKVYGFIWAILNGGAKIYRIIEPPDVTLMTTVFPAGAVYSGGPVLVMATDAAIITAALATFPTVTTDTLTAAFTSDRVFRVETATKILVIDGVFGDTDVDLTAMGIPFTMVLPTAVEANPGMLLTYNLVIVDCPGWGGAPPTAVSDVLKALVSDGGEVMFNDIALLDLSAIFPGFVSVVSNEDGPWSCVIHNPPITGFSAEYPSQYPTTFPTTVAIYTMGAGNIVDSLIRPTDVRVWMDSSVYGSTPSYRILGFYFQYGKGIVEGMAYHPQEQTQAYTGDPNSFVAGTVFFGNKFVFTPPPPPPPPPAAPVGGVLTPVNKLIILAPYLALICLVGAVTAVFAVRRRRKA